VTEPGARRICVGCGEYPLEGFENIDLSVVPPAEGYEGRPVIQADALTFDYRNAALVVAGHFMEHLTVEQARAWLRHVREHVPIGCVLVVTVPAWDRVHHADFKTLQDMGAGGGRWPGDQHRSWWRSEDVVRELREAEWTPVQEWADFPQLVSRVPWQVCIKAVK